MFDRIYGIYDLKAERVIGPLMFFPSDPAACRMFGDVVRSENTEVHAHPDDYALCCFGALVRDSAGTLSIDPMVSPTLFPVLTGTKVLEFDATKARVAQAEVGDDLFAAPDGAVALRG